RASDHLASETLSSISAAARAWRATSVEAKSRCHRVIVAACAARTESVVTVCRRPFVTNSRTHVPKALRPPDRAAFQVRHAVRRRLHRPVGNSPCGCRTRYEDSARDAGTESRGADKALLCAWRQPPPLRARR